LNLKSQAFNPKVNVMSKISSLVLAGLLVGANALAADTAPATATGTATATAPAAASDSASNADLDAQLAAARQKLEAAARDVAQLSSQLGQSVMLRVQSARTRAVLGLQLQVEPSARGQGAGVIGVSPGGPAAEAGVVTGDIIVAINGDATTGRNASREVVDHMATVKPDTKVTLKVMREGKVREFQVTPRASFAAFIPPLNGPAFNWIGPGGPGGGANFEGVELADLSPALGQYFGTSQGVLVVRVPHEGEFLKLQDGDVIQSIDGRVPENGSHATRILRSYQPGEKIHLKIMRQKKSVELEGTLPERRRFDPGEPGPGPGPRPVPPA
jgi:membrane-associated protease RseP (regulator of RpoE activity)